MTNVGVKPTIEGERLPGIETHIFDFSGELYGERVCVSFFDFLRPEQKFFSVEALRSQVAEDEQRALAYFESVDRAMESRGAMKKNEAGNEINFCLQSHIPMLYFVSMKLPVFGLTDTPTSG